MKERITNLTTINDFDAAGNLTETKPEGNTLSGAKRYTYTSAGLLTAVEMPNGAGYQPQVEIVYDVLGTRLSLVPIRARPA